MPLYPHENWGDIQKHIYAKGIITSVDSENDTAGVTVAGCQDGTDVPLFYHCSDDAEERSNGAIEGGAAAFSAGSEEDPEDGDEVIVMCEADTGEPVRIIGFVDGIKPCCLFMDRATNATYDWTYEGVVYNAFGSALELGYSNELSLSSMTYDNNNGLFTCEINTLEGYTFHTETAPAGWEYDVLDSVESGRSTAIYRRNSLNPVEIPIAGDGVYKTLKIDSCYGYSSLGTYHWADPSFGVGQAKIDVYDFIEIVNNRGHYCRLYFRHLVPMILTGDGVLSGSEVEWEVYLGTSIYGSNATGYPTWRAQEMLDPYVSSVNMYFWMSRVFMDIERIEVDGEYVYQANDGARYWIVGSGLYVALKSIAVNTACRLTLDIGEISVCPNPPQPYPDYPDRIGTGGMAEGEFYNLPNQVDEYRLLFQYQYEMYLPESPINPDFAPPWVG